MDDILSEFKIVVAEDDVDDQEMIKDAIMKISSSIKFRILPDGQELLDFLRGEKSYATRQMPNVVILDINMPRLNGIDALKEIKSNPKLVSVPIIMLSTTIDKRQIRLCNEYGCNSYFIKPNSFKELELIIQDIYDYWSSKHNFTATPLTGISEVV